MNALKQSEPSGLVCEKSFFISPAGAYLVLGILFGLVATFKIRKTKKEEEKKKQELLKKAEEAKAAKLAKEAE